MKINELDVVLLKSNEEATIIEKFDNVKIDIEQDGRVYVMHSQMPTAKACLDYIINLVREAEVGKVYEGKVIRIEKYGVFVELWPGCEGLCHISRLAKERVNKLNELGIMVDWQKVAFDENGNPRKQIVKPHIVAEMLRLGYIKNWDEGFVKFLNKGAPAYVHRKEPDAKEVIEFVLDNGAVPILAHPIHTKLKGKELFEFLQKYIPSLKAKNYLNFCKK